MVLVEDVSSIGDVLAIDFLTFPSQDVAWHVLHDSLFGSVSDDQKLMM